MGQFDHLPPQQQGDAWVRLMAERKRDLMKNDSSLSSEEAEERATTEIRREIRNG